MTSTKRYYDIDWLRTVIVLSIIPFHATIIFNQYPGAIMFVKDTMQVNSLVFLSSIVDRFHMVTLFLLSGMAIYFSLLKRNRKIFIKERFMKLFIPLLTGSLLLNPVTTYIWSLNQDKKESFLNHYIGFFTRDLGAFDGLNGGYTPAHLWFVLYLFVFSLLGLPIYKWLMKAKSKNVLDTLAAFFYKPCRLLLLAIPYCLFYLIEILDEKNPIAYFYVVLIGFLFATREEYLKAICRDKWIYLTLTIILYILFFSCRPSDGASMVIMYLFGFIVKLTKIIPAFAMIGLFHEYINKNSKALNYFSGACFTVYIVHMIIVTAVGFWIIQYGINPVLKFFIITIISYILSFGVYEIVRKNRILGLLFGVNVMQRR